MGIFRQKSKKDKSDFTADAPTALTEANESLSVIALANHSNAVETIFSSLLKYQYKTKLVFDVPSFVAELGEFDPDIILVSLNLESADAVKVITILQTLDLPVIVFGENDDEHTALRLLQTDLRHVIIPPVTFESFMERVEFLAMEKELAPNAVTSPAISQLRKTDWGKVIHLLKEKLGVGHANLVKGDEKKLGGATHQEGSITEAHADELTPVQEADLEIGRKLEADIYITMPLNHKFILYLRRGCVLTKENMDHLHRYGKARVMKKHDA
jgi:DNA-binding NarL/FixJ family response regulator